MSGNLGYWPEVIDQGGKLRKQFRFGEYVAYVHSDFDPFDDDDDDAIEYLYVMAVFKLPEEELCLCVASEMTAEVRGLRERHPELFPKGNHPFLGVFSGEIHYNLGASSDWADLEKFTFKALDVAP